MLRLPIDSFVSSSSLFGDYATQENGAVRSLIGGFDRSCDAWGRARGARAGDENSLARLLSRLADYNRNLGTAPGLVDRIGAIADGSARVVVTGQQPGVLGGPLMTLYKIETARALAEWVEVAYGVPCVPLYWMGADDADFAEIRELVVLGSEHQTLATSLPTGAHEVAMPVGDIDVKWLERLWSGLDAFVGGFGGAREVVEWVGAALTRGGDHGGATARIISALTRGGVAVVDGREPLLREAARHVILDYFDREDEVRTRVAAGGKELEALGFHAQLALGPDSGVFLFERGRRVKVTRESRVVARKRIDEDVRVASPGVALRNLVQDAVFDPVAVVLGPAEVAYRAQIRGVYELLQVERPVSYPRMFATYVPPAVDEMASACAADPARMILAPGDFIRDVFATQADPAVEDARRRLHAAFEAECEAFVGTVGDAMDTAAVAKTQKRLADVARRLAQATSAAGDVGRQRALRRWPFLEALPEVFARRGAPQERYLSMLTPFLFGGLASGDAVRAGARAHVEAAMDGRVEHIVYSS